MLYFFILFSASSLTLVILYYTFVLCSSYVLNWSLFLPLFISLNSYLINWTYLSSGHNFLLLYPLFCLIHPLIFFYYDYYTFYFQMLTWFCFQISLVILYSFLWFADIFNPPFTSYIYLTYIFCIICLNCNIWSLCVLFYCLFSFLLACLWWFVFERGGCLVISGCGCIFFETF